MSKKSDFNGPIIPPGINFTFGPCKMIMPDGTYMYIQNLVVNSGDIKNLYVCEDDKNIVVPQIEEFSDLSFRKAHFKIVLNTIAGVKEVEIIQFQ